jgi:hypothetical protein
VDVKEGSIFGQVKYLINFCVRKLRAFLRFSLTNPSKSDRKYDLKCRHLHFMENLAINIFCIKKRNLTANQALETVTFTEKVAHRVKYEHIYQN